jgi:cation diffusion facilitator family transporter
MAPAHDPDHRSRRRTTAAVISVVARIVILSAKLIAWQLTGSSAVASDALESIVNVLAAAFALVSIRIAARPRDDDHPYGHGKTELLAAAFEGGLVFLAAALIVWQAGLALWHRPALRELDLGLAVTAAAAVANLVLGGYLVRTGRAVGSPTLVADGQHVLSDVWTTAGVLIGLALVRTTGLEWFDPLAALAVGLLLARTGYRLVRDAAAALVDRHDPALLALLVDAFVEARVPGVTALRRVRALRHGHAIHVDADVVFPAHWTVAQAHATLEQLEAHIRARTGTAAELALHMDPCAPSMCAACDLAPCPARAAPFVALRRLTVADAIRSDPEPAASAPPAASPARPAAPR